jgi:trehalose synthase
MTDTITAPPLVRLDDYVQLLGREEIEDLRALAKRLSGRTVQMVNSTAVGGGVAEILNRMVPLIQELGVSIRWDVITGGNDFFEITKAFHNALHGGAYEERPHDFDTFLAYAEMNRQRLQFDSEFTVIHDPQPLPLIDARPPQRNHWIWRCHIDLSRPNTRVWEFLRPFVCRYDGALFSSPDFTRQLPIAQYLFFPCIDPLSEKNQDLEPDVVAKIAERFGIDRQRPVLVQISRFDRLKDPIGVLQAYQIVKRYADCQLVLAGGGADDDPEGEKILAEVRSAAEGDPDVFVLNLPPRSALEINALQRLATVVIQKSLREGFGLTVAEALWKRKPVVASAVGGIPAQVIHKHTGLLTHSISGAAYQIRFLLAHPEIAQKLGEQGREHVREHFLITSNVRAYLTLFLHSLGAEA